MGRASRQLRNRKKVILVWGLLLVVGGAGWLRRYCANGGQRLCSAGQELLERANSPFYGAAAALLVLGAAYVVWSRRRADLGQPGFKNQPWLYDRRILEMTGRVEYVLGDSLGEKLKRRVTDIYRNATGNEDWRNRYVHQRFLLSSPLLRRGDRLMILHNTKYGTLPIREGGWVRVRGEYLHGDDRTSSFFKRRHFYGQIHFTHEPRGFLELLSVKPENHEIKEG